MFCRNCGTKAQSGARFCTECGKPLGRVSVTLCAPGEVKEPEAELREAERARERERLRKVFGMEVPERDVRWGWINKKRLESGLRRKWDDYASCCLQMARMLSEEGNRRGALTHYFEYCYVKCAFDPDSSGWVCHVEHRPQDRDALNEVIELIRSEQLSKMAVRQIFSAQCKAIQSQRLPVTLPSPSVSWRALEKVLFGKNTQLGYYLGTHYTAYVDRVTELKRSGDLEEAARLLRALTHTVEEESRAKHWIPAPWYYTQLCIVCRKLKDHRNELDAAERYLALIALVAPRADGLLPEFLARRDKARASLERSRG